MHVVVIFDNIGGYHAARLRATYDACQRRDWQFTAVQVTDTTKEHPWGDMGREITFPLKTLLSTSATALNSTNSSIPATSLLFDCLNTLQPTVVAIPGWGFPISRAALLWCKRHAALSILMSESKWDDARRTFWKEMIKSWLYVKRYDAALVGGNLHRDYLVQLGFRPDRIFLGYDVVDNDYFSQQAEKARRDPNTTRLRQPQIPNKPYYLAATRFIKRKNIHRLIESFVAYREQVEEAHAWDLVICGTGVEEPSIRSLILNKGLNYCIHLPGFISYQDLGDWYGLAEAFIHPALQEQWGLVVNEACAAGLPILCSRTVGACHELIHNNHNGFLFDPENVEDMIGKLVNIHRSSSLLRAQMGKVSQKIITNYSPSNFADGLMQAAKSAMSAA
ncbi:MULTISPECIES: glycosyltransferase family 4 protein [Trichocoleus]|uniref:Glycosyltransferase family 4 protein n=1 Tax=Trichocoleus desertorum GB2-A4 TaxID=2933944 RepID=A0ABV0J795_9CYAN|nr:glycosyltransferase family 4 protein [Trichocoleus sp. FACHB-46]MBD1862613.1 glycosyltransferase family 4 protein [Trichocoleus sp. FACHB-46]